MGQRQKISELPWAPTERKLESLQGKHTLLVKFSKAFNPKARERLNPRGIGRRNFFSMFTIHMMVELRGRTLTLLCRS